MCARFDEWESEIKAYCENNQLNFTKAEQMSKCSNQDMLVLQYFDEEKAANRSGLLDETPMPVVLWVTRKKDGLLFEQTEFTKRYLS